MVFEPSNLPTQRLGGYEVLEPIRRGGMATLYLAKRVAKGGFERTLALKVLHDELASDERFLSMFFDEARICSQLCHPNLVQVEDLGSDRGLHYLAMEYIDGCSVGDLLRVIRRRGQVLDPSAAIHIAKQVADGLHAAHETRDGSGALLDIIHRDISPSNVLLSRAGHVKLIDFGIAKAQGRQSATAVGGPLKGKLRYMAPEQAVGGQLDRRADIYSLGVVLWELLAGRQLFKAKTEVELFERITNPAIEPPSQYNKDVSPELDQLTLSMLARDPEHRPASAADVVRLLLGAAGPRRYDAGGIARLVAATLSQGKSQGAEHRTRPSDASQAAVAPMPAPRRRKVVAETDRIPRLRRRNNALWLCGAGAVTFAAVIVGLWIAEVVDPSSPAAAASMAGSIQQSQDVAPPTTSPTKATRLAIDGRSRELAVDEAPAPTPQAIPAPRVITKTPVRASKMRKTNTTSRSARARRAKTVRASNASNTRRPKAVRTRAGRAAKVEIADSFDLSEAERAPRKQKPTKTRVGSLPIATEFD